MNTEDPQEKMRLARSKDWYDKIWKTVGKCVFCDLKVKYIITEENDIVLTVNLYPYIDGQLMAIPRKHISSPKELTPEQWETIRKFNYIAKKIMKEIYGYKGMWTLIREGGEIAQMTVTDHMHVQFIPFDSKDLCTWNFRELKNTPLQNVDLYREQMDKIIELGQKFMNKYQKKPN